MGAPPLTPRSYTHYTAYRLLRWRPPQYSGRRGRFPSIETLNLRTALVGAQEMGPIPPRSVPKPLACFGSNLVANCAEYCGSTVINPFRINFDTVVY